MSGVFNAPIYGMNRWGDLFTSRQKLAMITLRRLINEILPSGTITEEIIALSLSRFADISNALCQWENNKTQVRHLFTKQAIPMLWDFAEPGLFGGQAGDYGVTLETMLQVISHLPDTASGQVHLADARECPLPDEVVDAWFTDPPYYFAVPYADLSDFFFVWLKRTIPNHPLFRSLPKSSNRLVPKDGELCEMAHWDPVRYPNKDKAFFETGMYRAFLEGRRVLKQEGAACVVFAHKTTEGWEALLSGLTRAGWVVTASWPIATESATRPRARNSAALATSVHLVCRPRPASAAIGDWGDVFRALPKRVGDWMERLQSEGVRGADLVFACIGPALELYSQYAKVVDAEDREIPLGGDPEAREPHRRGYLAYVWEVVGRAALEQVLGTAEARARNGAAGALEEDARLTALFLWTLQSTKVEAPAKGGRKGKAAAAEDQPEDAEPPEEDEEGDDGTGRKKKGYTLVFDVARRFAQPLGIHLDDWEGRIIDTDKGLVRLLPVAERAGQLFGDEGAQAVAEALEEAPERALQMSLFPDIEEEAAVRVRGRRVTGAAVGDDALQSRRGATTLDRVHAAMLLQSSGRANALRALLAAEQARGPDFLRLANSLSALYPRESEEKRLLDAMLLVAPK